MTFPNMVKLRQITSHVHFPLRTNCLRPLAVVHLSVFRVRKLSEDYYVPFLKTQKDATAYRGNIWQRIFNIGPAK